MTVAAMPVPAGSASDLDNYGVSPSFTDAFGVERHLPHRTAELLSAQFAGSRPQRPPLIASPGRYHPELVGQLRYEDGTVGWVEGVCDVVGYHALTVEGCTRQVLVAPEQLPQPPRGWGWAAQLYATRSRESWGIGDFRDLAALARLARRAGAGSILISPIHAMHPGRHQSNSPYSPSSRLFLNLLHIAPALVPGADRVALTDLAAQGRDLNTQRRIDRNAVWELKRSALKRIFSATKAALPPEFELWRADRGLALQRYATWCAIAEALEEPNWRRWPVELRRADSVAVLHFAVDHAEQVTFHAWAQWAAELQLAQARVPGVDLIVDLAVGFDSSGADAWAYQDLLAFDFEVGCPPDGHNPGGQSWGLPPMDPNALLSAKLEPFIELVRAGLRNAGALRIDHVMQLWRLFWVPPEGASAGAYVHYPVHALLAVLRIEASRAGAWIVGEDMGTVAAGVREDMASIGMCGARACVRSSPEANPELSVGASSTHDQATVAGLITGSDVNDMISIDKRSDFVHIEQTRRSLAALAGIDPDQPIGPDEIRLAVLAQYRRLAASASRVVLASLDDAAAVAERPNMPGTIDEWPNWRIALPVPLEQLLAAPLAVELTEVLAGR
jgi:4-alpha-glucanotransferase